MRKRLLIPEHHGDRRLSHREYVGGDWERLGRLQLDFMVAEGLRPQHTLVDVACGSLRAGRHFIRYLDRGGYLGIEKHADLVEAGLRYEVPWVTRRRKRPEFVVSDAFEFMGFSKPADFGIAQSLFTHLTPETIALCLSRLAVWSPACPLYATFFEVDEPVDNPVSPHDHAKFRYTRAEMRQLAATAGVRFSYIGEWGHPRGQTMGVFAAS